MYSKLKIAACCQLMITASIIINPSSTEELEEIPAVVRLKQKLTRNYFVDILPRKNESRAVKVSFTPMLTRILSSVGMVFLKL